MPPERADISAIDLFCGAGGLSQGLREAGIHIAGGVDNDPACAFPYEENIKAPFALRDVREVTVDDLSAMWGTSPVRVLAGCAPCQPFSPYRRGLDTSTDDRWPLLDEFGRLVSESLPEIVTMENVPRVGGSSVFTNFVLLLEKHGYSADWRSCYGPRYGLPQQRRRLVLLASRIGKIEVPKGHLDPNEYRTVHSAIGNLPQLDNGGQDPQDPLHAARKLGPLNLARIRASSPGGTWRDWPEDLRAACHKKASGASFANVYARMRWDAPAPTITTLSYNFGAGRFGHPSEDRSISLREAAILQGFPPSYRFVRRGERVLLSHLGRLIGNAVPPPLALAVGRAIVSHVGAGR